MNFSVLAKLKKLKIDEEIMAKSSEILEKLFLNRSIITQKELEDNNFDYNHYHNLVAFKEGRLYSFKSKYHLHIDRDELLITKNI